MDLSKEKKLGLAYEAPPILSPPKQCSYTGCSRLSKPVNKGLIVPTPLPNEMNSKYIKEHLKKYNPMRYKYFQNRTSPRGQFVKIKCFTYYINNEGTFLGPFRGKDQKKSKVTLRPWEEPFGSVDESLDPYFNQHQLNAVSSLAETPHTGLSRSSSRMIIKQPSLFTHKKLLFEEAPYITREAVSGLCGRHSYSMYSLKNFYTEYKIKYLCLFFMPEEAPEYLSMYRDLGFNIKRKLKVKAENLKDYCVCICFWERKKMKSYYSNLFNFLLHQEYIVFLPSDFMDNEWVHTRQSPKDMAHMEWVKKFHPKLEAMIDKRNGLQPYDEKPTSCLQPIKPQSEEQAQTFCPRRESSEIRKRDSPLWCNRNSRTASDPFASVCFNRKKSNPTETRVNHPISSCNILFGK